jgi:23S rRNA (guanosine2251-2'-O)-methyltransferase
MREWISGRNPVYETLRAGRRQPFRLRIALGVEEKGRISEILRLARSKKLPVERLPRQDLDVLGMGNQGVALEVSGYPYSDLTEVLTRAARAKEPPFILILDTLQDPQNLGTLLRTAESTGVHGVVLPLRHTTTVTPAVVHASSGASEYLLVLQANLAQVIASLKEAGVWVVGLENGAEGLPSEQVDLAGPLALVVGSEAEGMRPLVRDSCDLLLRLPMRGRVDSLNAAVAGSIALYLAWQRRGFPGQRAG